MELQQAKAMALELMEQHGLIADGWQFEWDFKVKRWVFVGMIEKLLD